METTTSYSEEQQVQPAIGNIILKGGIITGLISSILSIVFIYILGNLGNMTLQVLIGVITAVFGIYFTQKAFKDQGDGFMAYGKGLVIALATMAVAGLIAGALNILYINFVDDTIPGQIVDATIETTYEMTEKLGGDIDAVEAEFEGKRDEMVDNQKSFINILWSAIASAVFGLILGLIVTAFTKETPPESEF